MGVTVTAKASFERKVYRRSKSGTISEVEVGNDEYSKPGDGEKHVRITGYAEPFEMTGVYGTQTKTRIELLILAPQKLARQRFDTLMTLSVGPKSNLGKLIAAGRDADVEVGEEVDLDDILGLELYVSTQKSESDKGFTNINVVACRPLDGDEGDGEEGESPAQAYSVRSEATPKRGRPAADDDDAPPY